MYPEANVMSLSNETNPVHFPPQSRRTTLYSILLEKLREETGTNWNLLRPLSDDLYRFHSQAQIEVRTDDASGTISIHPLDANSGMEDVDYLVTPANHPEIFLGGCGLGFDAPSRGQYGLWPVRRHAGTHDAGI